MAEITPIIRVTAPRRQFQDHKDSALAVAVFPDGHRMITSSVDQTLVLWDLQNGVSLKKMEGHHSWVWAVAVSKDGNLIASGDDDGKLIVWHGDTGELLFQAAEVHAGTIRSLDFSPDGTVLASGSFDRTTELWSTETWQVQGNPINGSAWIFCVRYSPSGEYLAISTEHDIQIWNPCTRECIAKLKAEINKAVNLSLAWAPHGGRLFSVGAHLDPTIREWDTSSWKQIGEPWTGHTRDIRTILVHPNATFIASASDDCQVRLWRFSDRRTIAILKDSSAVYCASFSADGTSILSGGNSTVFKEWAVPEEALKLLEDTSTQDYDLKATPPAVSPLRLHSTPSTSIMTAKLVQVIPRITQSHRAFKNHKDSVFAVALLDGHRMVTSSGDQTLILWNLKDGVMLKQMEGHKSVVRALAVSRDGKLIASGDDDGALIAWDGVTGESLTQAITVHSSSIRSVDFSQDGTALASGSFDKTTEIWCTKTWQVSGSPINCHGNVFCVRYSPSGKFLAIASGGVLVCDTRTRECIVTLKTLAHSLAWTPDGTRLFSGGNDSDPNIREWDTLTWTQAGDHRSGHTDYVNAIAINPTGTLVASASGDTHVRLWRPSDRRTIAIFKDSVELYFVTFSADGKYIISGGRQLMVKEWAVPEDALLEATYKGRESEDALLVEPPEEQATTKHTLLGDASEEQATTKHTLSEDVPEKQATNEHIVSKDAHLDWSTGFKQECGAFYVTRGDAALAASNYDMAIELYSAAIDLDSASDTILAKRSKAKLDKKLWEEALLDAQKIIELNPSSYIGYQLEHAALHGARRYVEAITAFEIMLARLDDTPDTEIRKLRLQYASPFEAAAAVQAVVYAQLENTPHRLFNTFTGRLCDRGAQMDAFQMSTEYKELMSSSVKHADLRAERIKQVVAMYFSCAMLSHRWEENELLLQDIQDKIVYKLNPVGGIMKVQSFCQTARDAGYRWAWIDTCCIDQTSNVEVQKSVNSMFVWYRHSGLTIVYLVDVLPSSKSGALAKSVWNKRGWTVQEFLAPKVVLFYQNDWTLYLGDRSPNHKESGAIMQELADATGIDARALVSFRPEMKGAREKLQWASARVTTLPEDMAYSLFGIFDIQLPVLYGEREQNALGRLLQEIVARSGDISALDWVGNSSKFNSCLPADISSYKALPFTLPSLSEIQIQTSISSLRHVVAMNLALRLYNSLESMTAPRFAHCRLHLPCLVFPVTEVRRGRVRDQKVTHEFKTNGLDDLTIITEDKLPARETLLLVYPWNHDLLEQLNPADDTQNMGDYTIPGGSDPGRRASRFIGRVRQLIAPVDSESYLRALRLIVRLGQPFRAFLLAQRRGGEYRRIATDHDIIAQVRDTTSVRKMMDVRVVEIL